MPDPIDDADLDDTEPSDAAEAATAPTAVRRPRRKAADVDLCEVHKDGERLLVHPATVAAHVEAGWRTAP